MNITLIGMSGSGKSYIGKELADSLGFAFVDPDTLMEQKYGKPLQQILEMLGDENFLREEVVVTIDAIENANDTVLATGGSII
jgi:shikimate kinase